MAVAPLPETAAVPWRPRMDVARLRTLTRAWKLTTLGTSATSLPAPLLCLQPYECAVAG